MNQEDEIETIRTTSQRPKENSVEGANKNQSFYIRNLLADVTPHDPLHIETVSHNVYTDGASVQTPQSDRRKRPRTSFSAEQVRLLECEFGVSKYLSVTRRAEVACKLGMSETQVKIWFQNRRTKWKRRYMGRMGHYYFPFYQIGSVSLFGDKYRPQLVDHQPNSREPFVYHSPLEIFQNQVLQGQSKNYGMGEAPWSS